MVYGYKVGLSLVVVDQVIGPHYLYYMLSLLKLIFIWDYIMIDVLSKKILLFKKSIHQF